jgi:tRNA pseudouridine65 synthase
MIGEDHIIYKDKYIVAVNKPSGLLIHPGKIARHEKQTLMKQVRDFAGQWVYPVHRLDRPTSGIVVFAFSSEVAASLTQQFTNRQIKKTYIAIVRGFTEESSVIDKPLKEIIDKMSDTRTQKNKPAQNAVTRYKTLEKIELDVPVRPYKTARYSMVMASPLTGRQQQIRRHFKSIFHPIIGDPKHGDNAHNKMLRKEFGLCRLMLHSSSIILKHPFTMKELKLTAALPQEFLQFLKNLGFARFTS